MATSAKVVDFSGVKDRGDFNTKRVPSGDYLAKIVKVEDGESKKDKGFQYVFTIKLVKYSQYAYPYYCKLQENQLWKLRNLLVAAGMTVPKKRMKLDPSKVVGKTIGVTMEDDEHEGKEKSVVDAVFPASELGDDVAGASGVDDDEDEGDEEYEDDESEDEVDEAPEADDDEEEEADDEEADTTDEFEGMSRTELKKYINGKDTKFAFKKSQTDDELRAKARELAAAGGSDDDDDELEELDIEDL